MAVPGVIPTLPVLTVLVAPKVIALPARRTNGLVKFNGADDDVGTADDEEEDAVDWADGIPLMVTVAPNVTAASTMTRPLIFVVAPTVADTAIKKLPTTLFVAPNVILLPTAKYTSFGNAPFDTVIVAVAPVTRVVAIWKMN